MSKLCIIDPNFTEGNFLGEGPEFLDLFCKIQPDVDHDVDLPDCIKTFTISSVFNAPVPKGCLV